MPIVPRYDPQASPTAQPLVSFDAPPVQNQTGAQLQQLGAGAQSAAQGIGQVARDIYDQANQLRVDDALNQAKEAALRLAHDPQNGYTNLRGINALQRPGGMPLAEEYSSQLKDQIGKIAESLGGDAQRKAFDLHANDLLTSFQGQAMQHESQEFKTYGLSVAEGIQKTAMRDIALNWNNPEAINSAVGRIKAETYRQGLLSGLSAEWQDARARDLASNGHKLALMTALEQNNPAYAHTYLKRYADQMTAEDILSVQGHITREASTQIGMASAQAVLARTPGLVDSDSDRAFNILLAAESGGKQFDASGKPLTSSAGAVGIAQIMLTTGPEAAKLAGVTWNEKRFKSDPDYNRQLGMAYFQKQLQTNGGDLAKAYAAYNAGPGALKAAVQQAKDAQMRAPGATPQSPDYWLTFLPKETQNYVRQNMTAYNAGQGQTQRPSLLDVDRKLRADPMLATNPQALQVARQEATRLYEQQTQAIKQRDEQAVADAMRAIMQNGGRYTDLSASVRANVPPKEVDNLLNFASRIAKGDDSTSPLLYNQLSSHPETLAQMSDSQFYALHRELSEADFKHFSGERAKQLGVDGGNKGFNDLNSTAIKNALDDRLSLLKVDISAKSNGGDDAARVGAIRRFVDQTIIAAQTNAGKKFNDAEIAQHLDSLFARNATFNGFFSKSSGPMMTMKIGDIDSAAKDNIRTAFKNRGVDNPTDAQILNAYWALNLKPKKP